jgi:hypothetical protein
MKRKGGWKKFNRIVIDEKTTIRFAMKNRSLIDPAEHFNRDHDRD